MSIKYYNKKQRKCYTKKAHESYQILSENEKNRKVPIC